MFEADLPFSDILYNDFSFMRQFDFRVIGLEHP